MGPCSINHRSRQHGGSHPEDQHPHQVSGDSVTTQSQHHEDDMFWEKRTYGYRAICQNRGENNQLHILFQDVLPFCFQPGGVLVPLVF